MNKDNSITVEDDGRGIPVDIHKPKITGCRSNNDSITCRRNWSRILKVSGGLHGVGFPVNALSEKLELKIFRDNKEYEITLTMGIQIKLKQIGKKKKEELKLPSPSKIYFQLLNLIQIYWKKEFESFKTKE